MAKRKPKRKRGGQPGNGNARKHGFYSRFTSPDDRLECMTARAEGLPSTLGLMRGRIIAVLRQDPGNTRVLREAALAITKYYRSHKGLSSEDAAAVHKNIRALFDHYRKEFLENAGTNQDGNDDHAGTK